MIDGKILGIGHSAITYKCTDGSALKVFYTKKYNAEGEWKRMSQAYEKGLKVPRPINLGEIVLEDEDIKKIGRWKRFCCNIGSGEADYFSSPKCPVIKKEFIEGIPLYNKWFPDKKIRKKTIELHEEIENAGFLFYDIIASNYVLTPTGEIFLIDCEELLPQNEYCKPGKAWNFLKKNSPICKLEDWLFSLAYTSIGILTGEGL
jgi:RIO-like serine/threonine protein kinase